MAHLKGPEKEGRREPVYYPSRPEFIDGIDSIEPKSDDTPKITTGDNITNDNGVISITKQNVIDALGYTPPTQDTTYSTGTSTKAGITKLYSSLGTNSDGAMTQAAVKAALDAKNYSNFVGANTNAAGTNGLVPAPKAGDNEKFLRGDGQWATVSGGSEGESYSDFVGANTNVAGTNGLVPAPAAGDNEKFLRGDGTWTDVPEGKSYSDFVGANTNVAGTNGLVPAPAAGDNEKFLRGDGTWTDIPEGESYSNFVGADAVSGGVSGLVPAPEAGDNQKFLRADGTWATPMFSFSLTPSAVEGAIWLEDDE